MDFDHARNTEKNMCRENSQITLGLNVHSTFDLEKHRETPSTRETT